MKDIHYELMLLMLKEKKTEKDRERINAYFENIDIDKFFAIAKEHDVETILYGGAEDKQRVRMGETWNKDYLFKKDRIEFMFSKLEILAEKLEKKSIPVIALKNGGIALQITKDYGMCPMGDIDLLVKKQDFMETHKTVIDMGFRFQFRSVYEKEEIQEAYLDGGSEYYYPDECGNPQMWIEISWRPIAGRWIRVDKEPDAARLFEQSEMISGSKVRVLSPEDNLLQVCIHTAKHSYVREPGFRLHLDVERIVSNLAIDWDLFLKKVEIVGTKNAVYYSLLIPKMLFNTSVPEWVLEKLKPSNIRDRYIRRKLARASVFHPKLKKFTRIEFVFFQLALYDSWRDTFKVILPGVTWLKSKYQFSCPLLVPVFVVIRMFDLVGIRARKK